jgi:putative transposase
MDGEIATGSWILPETVWVRIEPLLPEEKRFGSNGRPVVPFRKVMAGIFYAARTGCQWKAVPKEYGSGSTVHRRFQEWTQRGVVERFWEIGLDEYDDLKGILWKFQAIDGGMNKAPLGGKKTGRNPTDRGKLGTKRSVATDGRGVPLSVVTAGANRHDMKLAGATLAGMKGERPDPVEHKQHMCMDKGYDYPEIRDLILSNRYLDHIKARGEEEKERKRNPRYKKARRWVVKRTHSWLNRWRKLLVRFEKKDENHLALTHLACGVIALRAAGVLG